MRILCTLALAFVMMTAATAAQALNPQPEPPGRAAVLNNTQPAAESAAHANTSGTPRTIVSPRHANSNLKARKATWAAGSDSGDAKTLHGPGQKATWAAGSDSGSDGHGHNLGPGLGTIHMND